MPLKNYTTKVPATRSVDQIQQMLVKHGAMGVLFEYEQGTGRIAALSFRIKVGDRDVAFKLPNNWRAAGKVMLREGNKRADDEEYVYRVSWRIMRDWVDAQMAILEIEMVAMEQIFLPYAVTQDGRTVYDAVKNTLLLE